MKTIHEISKALFLAAFSILILASCEPTEPDVTDPPAGDYETVEGDPLGTRIYTLENGLKVYLSVNKKEPRVQTLIAVRAGSKSDPANTTGLAHYLEHMLFKGTSNLGTLDWAKEKPILDQIENLYEEHLNTSDDAEKKAIYKQIDSLSFEASKYVAPNEYDKMISSLGAKGTNAYTSVEQTVYVNDIPANELEKWMKLEAERFNEAVLRIFHTELEVVYEEFNRGQDSDSRQSWYALNRNLFPTHPYGTQTTLGKGEHLKNPSMVNIYNYFNTYYVPNNVAICLAGDLDPDKTIEMVKQYFGGWEKKEVPAFDPPKEQPITAPVVEEIVGPQREHVYVGYRFPGASSDDALTLELIDGILANGQAGLIDLDLVQKQKVLNAYSFPVLWEDYSFLALYGQPRDGQTLEEVKDLLLAEVEKIKAGEFEDWLISAVIKNRKLDEIRSQQSNRSRASKFVNAFVRGLSWESEVSKFTRMEKITKQQVMDFAKKHLNDNRVEVYKRKGEPKGHKVDKPEITPIQLNRDSSSEYFTEWSKMESGRLTPQFLDYQNLISSVQLRDDIRLDYVKNPFNELFQLNYILDMGTDNNKQLGLAINYLPYLGTDKYTAEELQKEFFKLGMSFDVNSSKDKVYVTLEGLDESFEEGVKLFEHILSSVQPDEAAYGEMVKGIMKSRMDTKTDKGAILWTGMLNYAKYAENSSLRNVLSQAQLEAVNPADLTEMIKGLSGFKHRVFYYGPNTADNVNSKLAKLHTPPADLKDYPPVNTYAELAMTSNKVYVVDYDMKQTEVLLLSQVKPYDKTLTPYSRVFNEYFGSGLSSIVFQEIRESKALAYSAFSAFSTPRKENESHYVYGYVGTQADKLGDAVDALLVLMSEMPQVESQYDGAVDAAMKKIESERTVGASIFWSYEAAKKLGLDYDIRKDVYAKLPEIKLEDLNGFFQENIAGRSYTYMVLGKRSELDIAALEKLGEVEYLTVEQLFNY